MTRAGFHVQPVAGFQIEVSLVRMKHDAAGDSVEYLVIAVRMPFVFITRFVSPRVGVEALLPELAFDIVPTRRFDRRFFH
jgi:hypothetical protein